MRNEAKEAFERLAPWRLDTVQGHGSWRPYGRILHEPEKVCRGMWYIVNVVIYRTRPPEAVYFDCYGFLNPDHVIKEHRKFMDTVTNLCKRRKLWQQACEYEDIRPAAKFYVFSDNNPYTQFRTWTRAANKMVDAILATSENSNKSKDQRGSCRISLTQ